MQYENSEYQGYYNVGPDESDCVTTGTLADLFCEVYGENASWKNVSEKNAVHEAGYLKLNTDKLKSTFGWAPVWDVKKALEMVAQWTKAYYNGEDINEVMTKQINCFWESINA